MAEYFLTTYEQRMFDAACRSITDSEYTCAEAELPAKDWCIACRISEELPKVRATLARVEAERDQHRADLHQLEKTLRKEAEEWLAEAERIRKDMGQRTRRKSGYEMLETCGLDLRELVSSLFPAPPQEPTP